MDHWVITRRCIICTPLQSKMETELKQSNGWSRSVIFLKISLLHQDTETRPPHRLCFHTHWYVECYALEQVAVRFGTSAEARDSGIQIFDKFLSIAVAEDAKALLDIHLISYSAAVSVVLGSKIHDGNKCVTLVSRIDFICILNFLQVSDTYWQSLNKFSGEL